ncbi:DUF3489 domain-containing protein [Neoroseomonas lacus]|uniref:DUF3489 domain-containing protein n=1 Tax=Neoroseomonas lacus TaxID=287609 RepID=A0A917NZW1_9PROT|nr:DUF3489 domain-containing protein [Neoroseomonas lacus]GGJ45361.1 hypothetical protein GCM10011320_60970 [Neoroseomonas lacus]
MTKLSDTQRVILSKAAQHQALLAESPAKLPAAARNAVLRSLLAKTMLEEIAAPRELVGLGWRQDGDGAWIALRITDAGLRAIGLDPVNTLPDDGEPVLPRPAAATETADLLTEPQGDSQAALQPAPPADSVEAAEGPQRPPASQHGPIGRAAALHMAAATVLAAWDAPERDGLDGALAALREVLAATPRAARASRPLRDLAAPRQPRTGTKQEAVLALLRREEGAAVAQVIEATDWQPHTVRGFLAGLKRRGITVEVLERVRQVGPNKQGAKGSYSIYRIATAAPAEAV